MIAGDRQHVSKARDVHGVVNGRRDRIAFTCNQRRRNGTSIAGQRRTDLVVNRLAYRVNDCRVSQPKAWLRWRRLDLQSTEGVAGSPNLLKIHIARKVIAARSQCLHGRRQMCLQLDEAADWRSCTLSYGDTHTLRWGSYTGRVETVDTDHNTIAAFSFFTDFNKSRERSARDWAL